MQGWVPDNKTWIAENICPNNETLDLLAMDPSWNIPTHVFRNVLEICQPKLFFVENSAVVYQNFIWSGFPSVWHSWEGELFKKTH